MSLYVALSDAYHQAGNDTGAVLTLKQAEQVAGRADPTLQRNRAELYLQLHQPGAAIAELTALRDAELLTDAEILELARLLAHNGKIDESIRTLEKIQRRDPDNLDAKVVEAEVLLLRGDEVLAGKLMDRLLGDTPDLTNARLLRARYFTTNQQYELAEKDLAFISGADARRTDVVSLKAKVMNKLERFDEAAGVLEPLVEELPRDAQLLALLAETRLFQKRNDDAHALVNRALSVRPNFPRALYVRGRASEAQGEADAATADYEAALKSDPTFAPALSRLWGLWAKKGNKAEAMAALEKLFFMNEISADEKVSLATFYADTGSNLDRGVKLMNEALKREPKNAEYLAIKAHLMKQAEAGEPRHHHHPQGALTQRPEQLRRPRGHALQRPLRLARPHRQQLEPFGGEVAPRQLDELLRAHRLGLAGLLLEGVGAVEELAAAEPAAQLARRVLQEVEVHAVARLGPRQLLGGDVALARSVASVSQHRRPPPCPTFARRAGAVDLEGAGVVPRLVDARRSRRRARAAPPPCTAAATTARRRAPGARGSSPPSRGDPPPRRGRRAGRRPATPRGG